MWNGEIYGTLGPSCKDVDTIMAMLREGMTGMRLNLSHTDLEKSRPWIEALHEAAKRTGTSPELLIDMQGPELRIGTLNVPLELQKEEQITLGEEGKADIPVPVHVYSKIENNNLILLDDGKIELKAMTLLPDGRVVCKVLRGGTLTSHKSIKVVDKDITGPVLTKQDLSNIRVAKEFGVSALMQPFVRSGKELQEVRTALKENGAENLRVFAKIENREGMRNLDNILPEADMIVIARGDLGNDMPLWDLPVAQKEIEQKCIEAGKPFLVVTQMLTSMIHSPVPTRAEVSDIANAVLDGASAVMVTNETAAGEYPIDVIRYLKRTACAASSWREEARPE